MTSSEKVKISVVCCVFNEEDNISPLYQGIQKSLQGFTYEVIFVDDGSTDNTTEEVKRLNNKNVFLVELAKNYGQSTALAAGIDFATGDLICTIDGDLQNDPADIPKMTEIFLNQKVDVVAGIRKKRKDGLIFRKLPSKIANSIIRKVTGVNMRDYGCTLRVFRSHIAKNLGLYGELHRFIPVLACLQGAKMLQMEVNHFPRIHGKSKYGINRTFKVMADLILMVFFLKYLSKPMHLFGIVGLFIFLIGIVLDLYLLFLKAVGHDLWGKPMLMLAIMLTLGGIQLITTGILAEILMRTYYESQSKKTYQIRQISTVFKKPKREIMLN